MDFFSEQLVSSDYVDRLRRDLERADACRFLVAYVSSDGLRSIGRDLTRVLAHHASFGVGSLTCSCGFDPLMQLQEALGESHVRLKYFMDPKVQGTDEPDDIVLFHSKLVYLWLRGESKSVVYIGSHNWTSRALGPTPPRNAEASIRFEVPFETAHLEGSGPSLTGQVNRHLIAAFNRPACLPATSANRTAFEQWCQWSCNYAPRSPLELVTVILAVCKSGPAPPADWAGLSGQSIYMQVLDGEEGSRVRQGARRILVMVWPSRIALNLGSPPVLLRCHVSTQNPGPTSEVVGTNKSRSPIMGFRAVLFDGVQLAARRTGHRQEPAAEHIWSGKTIEFFDFEFSTGTGSLDSSVVDGGISPADQFLLEVDQVAFPAGGPLPDDPKMLWQPSSFAVATSKEDARLERIEGYYVTDETRERIMASLVEEFGVDPEKALTLPISNVDVAREGKRLSRHALHDAFLGPATKQGRESFYERAKRGALVADIDEHSNRSDSPAESLFPDSVRRTERLFTMKLKRLAEEWTEEAARFREAKRGKPDDR